MQKSAPSVGRILIAGGLHALVLRPAPLPLGRLRRPGSAASKSYRITAYFPEATRSRSSPTCGSAASPSARSSRSSSPRSTSRSTARTRPPPRSRSSRSSRRSPAMPGRSCASEDAARRDVRRADLRHASPREVRRAGLARRRGQQLRRRDSDVESIPEGGSLGLGQVQEQTQIDEIFNALDSETRTAFQRWQQNAAVAIRGRSLDLNDALGNLGPFLSDASDVLALLRRQRDAAAGPGPRHRHRLRRAQRARRAARDRDHRVERDLRRARLRGGSRCATSSRSRRRSRTRRR